MVGRRNPKKIFKYVTEERFLSISSNLNVCFASSKLLNDVYEGIPRIDSLVHSRKDIVPNLAFETSPELFPFFSPGMSIQNFRNKFHESEFGLRNSTFTKKTSWQLLQHMFSRAGVFCASSNNSSPIMWGMYAENGKGVCIEFSTESKFIKESVIGSLLGLHQVQYKSQPPKDIFINTPSRYLRRIFLTKSDAWSYESEFRCFRHLEGNQEFILAEICSRDIISITIGPNASQDTLLNIFHFKERNPHIRIFHAIPSTRSYQLSICEIYDLQYGIALFKDYVSSETPFNLESDKLL